MPTYDGLRVQQSDAQPHLGGNIVEGDPITFAPLTWGYLIDRFALNSVLDLGSGAGYSAHWFSKRGLAVLAVDGLPANVENAVYPTILADLTRGPISCRVDLVHCQEVVEHIEEQFVDHLIQSLACGKFIVMSHALPGQDGHHHVNCQASDYWIEKLAGVGCYLLETDTTRVRELSGKDGAVYLTQSGLVFCNRRRS